MDETVSRWYGRLEEPMALPTRMGRTCATVLMTTRRFGGRGGSSGGYRLAGKGGPDLLKGGDGTDVLIGGGGRDTCIADANDTVRSCEIVRRA
jgi:hypothetical protein